MDCPRDLTLYAAIDGGSVHAVAYRNLSSVLLVDFGERPSHEWLPMAVDLLAMTSGACRVRVDGGLKVKVKRSGVLKVPTMKFMMETEFYAVLGIFECAASVACIVCLEGFVGYFMSHTRLPNRCRH